LNSFILLPSVYDFTEGKPPPEGAQAETPESQFVFWCHHLAPVIIRQKLSLIVYFFFDRKNTTPQRGVHCDYPTFGTEFFQTLETR
jgi:hypothetical protein